MYYSTVFDSPVGLLTLASDGENIVGLWNAGQKHYGKSVPEAMISNDDLPVFAVAKSWLERYFVGEKPQISELPLAPIGSEFRRSIWNILCEIPYGEVITYGSISEKIAERMGKATMSSQAVGGAVAHNPISIIIPCHRVVGANGSLTGYAGGIAVKIKLLQLEGADISRFSVPTKGTAL